MFRDIGPRVLKWLWEQLDPMFALLLGAICSILGIIGVIQPSIVASATLLTLTVLAFALMRDRSEREKLQSKLSQFAGRFEDANPDFFFKHTTDETSLLQDAEREAWLIQETGNFILETKKAQIASLLRRGGTVRFVVTTPIEETARLVAFRNADMTSEAIITRSNSFLHHIESILREIGEDATRLQVRFTPYPIDTTSILVDPSNSEQRKRRAVIRNAGFRVPYDKKLDFSIRGDMSPKVFSHYFQEAQYLFENASKIILLTGEPRVGKTKTIKKLIDNIADEEHSYLFFVISYAIWKGDERTGFEVVTSASSERRSFATRRSEGDYEIDTEVWTSVATELEQAHKSGKIIILDEIGPFQLMNPRFLSIVEKIVNDPTTIMFATVASDDRNIPPLRKIKYHYRSTLLRLTSIENERIESEKNLEQEMKTALNLAKLRRNNSL